MKDATYAALLCALVLAAAATRAALAWGSPRPFGYAWDLHHEAAVWTYERGRLPAAADCGECYHPPLFAVCGAPLYALGAAATGRAAAGLRLLALFSLLCGAAVSWFSHRTLRLLRPSRGDLLLGTALTLALPCLAIASWSAENDALLAALMSVFFYRLCLWHLHPARSSWKEPVLLGVLAGLSALTKYSGLLALPAAAAVAAPRLLGRRPARAARGLLLLALAAAAVCGPHYAGNWRASRRPLLGPPWDPNVFSLDASRVARNRGHDDFLSLRLGAVLDLYRPGDPRALNDEPAYRGVLTTLHALTWTDMSFFSVPGRHGWRLPVGYAADGPDLPMIASTPANAPREPAYPAKRVWIPLIAAVLILGLVPTALALAGAAATLRRRALRPFVVYAGIALAAYAAWILAQPWWALKAKYLLFLTPVYVSWSILGLRAARRLDRRLGLAAAGGFIAALLAAESYLLMFALN